MASTAARVGPSGPPQHYATISRLKQRVETALAALEPAVVAATAQLETADLPPRVAYLANLTPEEGMVLLGADVTVQNRLSLNPTK